MCYGDIERIVILGQSIDSYLQEGAPGWELKADTRRNKKIIIPITLLQVDNPIFLNIILTPQTSERNVRS